MTTTNYDARIPVTENALLHLYFKIKSNGGYHTTESRNKILIAYLKPKIKDLSYKPVKAFIRTMVISAQKPGADLESVLLKLYNESLKYLVINDAAPINQFFELLNCLNKEHGIDSMFLDEKSDFNVKAIYIEKSEIECGFNEVGDLISPLHLMVKMENVDVLKLKVDEKYLFSYEIYRKEDMALFVIKP